MSTRSLVAILVGAIFMYVWASATHMSPLGFMGIGQIPNDAAVIASVKQGSGGKAGLYRLPGMSSMDAKGMAEATARSDKEGSGVVIFSPPGAGAKMDVTTLGGEFLLELLETAIAVWLLSKTSLNTLAGRLSFFAGLGVLAMVTTNASYMLWYKYPGAYTFAAMLIEFGKYLFAGLGVALVLGWKGRSATPVAANA